MSPKRYFFIMLGILVVLTLAAGYGYYFAISSVATARTTLATALTDQANAQQQIDNTAKLKTQYEREIVPILSRIDDALPRTKNQTEILAQLQTVASSSGLSLSSVTLPSATGIPGNTSQTVATSGVLALPITFQLVGSYDQLQSFLTKVENLNRFTNVTNLSVSRAGNGNSVTYSMTVNAYIKP